MPNVYPGDPWERIRQLERDVEELKALLGVRQPLTKASAGWEIPSQSTPAVPDTGGHLYASGADPYWRDSSGLSYTLKPQVVPGVSVADPPDFTSSSSAGPTYDSSVQNMLTNLRADAAGTKIALDNLLSSLRGGGAIAS
ncbi:hypothetical protein [Nonomuraea typhae]|uniref:hypothetical protein n=1 Tax=Nonomuraea typhae TaxID=2603600 RepID=UPI0012FBF799|nr:hypothetical protein [Nonomuraea typhae]